MLNSLHEEKDILLDLLNGSENAFEKIYELYSPRLYGKLLKLVKSEPQAKEILQDVFLKLWEHRKSIDPDKSFRSYLFRIAENKVYDFFRKAARDRVMEARLITLSIPEDNVVEETLRVAENVALLNQAIDLLPPQRQQVIKLCKLEGKSYKEVSELLGISVSTISDHIVKGTKSIRQYFEKNHKAVIIIVIAFLTKINF